MMKKGIYLKLLAFFLIFNYASAQKPGTRVPYKLFNDFETGELFGWETYPYAQDIAFDALYFASKTPTYKNSKYALARPLKAHDTNELYQGFTKRLNIYSTPDTRVRAAVYFQSDRNPESLELSLGTFDGNRYMHKIDKPLANTWLELDIPIAEFSLNGQALKAGGHIQAITIKGTYSVVNYLFTYTILMDDFQINGERDGHFLASAPVSTNFEMFDISILNKHYFFGDNFSLKTSPEGNISLKQLKGSLVDSRGQVVKDNISFTRIGNEWQNESICKFSEKDAPGQWEIRLQGLDNKDAALNYTFRFLMPGKKVNEHPRLFFSENELLDRLAKEKSPVAKRILGNVLKNTEFLKVDIESIKEGVDRTSESLVGGPYAKNTVGFNAFGVWDTPNSTLGSVITQGSFRYAFIHDAAAGEIAKKALLKLCSFSKWNADWMLERKFWTYYPVGYTLTSVAYGYDMLYNLLTDAERVYVRNAIMEKGLKLFHRDMVEMNRIPSDQTNHIARIVAGYGLAATAIYGDDPANPYLEPYISGIITKAKSFIDRTFYEDGSYGEPKSGYMDSATENIVWLIAAIERNFGIDYSTTTNVQNFYKYPLQASHSNGLIHNYGDDKRHYDGFTREHAEWFVKRTGNPFLYNYVKPYWEAGKGGYLGYLWFRDDIMPVPRETLAPSKTFSAQGMVMRSGWDDASTIISTRVGPNANHAHYDQGSFQIMANGEELLTDPGMGSVGYYLNLEYLRYNIHAIAHNVLLIDHDPESQNPAHYDNGIKSLSDWPRMIHTFNGKNADAVTSDLSSVYKDKLEKYSRTLLYTKTGPVFLFDQVKSKSSQGHVYDWLFHAPQNTDNQRSMIYRDGRMTIDRPNARLSFDVISPDIVSSSIRDKGDKIMFSENFLTLESKPDLVETNFFAVILPETKPADSDYGARPVTTRIESTGWLGAKIEHSTGSDLGFFRTGKSASGGGFTTDADRFTASFDKAGKLLKVYFEGSAISGQGISVKADHPLTAAISISSKQYELELQSDQAGTVTLLIAGKPSSILINGKAVRGWTYDERTKALKMQVPQGRNDFTIRTNLK